MARKKTPDEVVRDFAALIRAIPHQTKLLLMEAARIAEEERRKGFASGHGPEGEKWKKLKDSTIRRKKKKGYKDPEKPLLAKHTLSKGRIGANTKRGFVKLWESRKDISGYHDKGTSTIPARPHWGIYGSARIKIKLTVRKFAESLMKRLARG